MFCAITHDQNGQLLNTNADTIASELAIAFAPQFEVELYYCFEKKGVLMDPSDGDSVISSINPVSFIDLKEKGIVSAGMIPKLENALKAISEGVSVVRLCHADNLHKNNIGTKISA